MRKVEIWRMKPEPRKVAAVGEELFEEYLRKKKETLSNDFGTNWFGRMMAVLLNNVPRGTYATFSVVDVTGASRTVEAKRSISYSLFNSTYSYDCGGYIGIGTGTTPPTRTDYRLESEVARLPASATFADGGDVVAVSATFTLTSDVYVTEVGLYLREGYNGCIWLLDRSLLDAPVLFPTNTPMTVAYIFAV